MSVYLYKEVGGAGRTARLTSPEGVEGPPKVLSFINPKIPLAGLNDIQIFELVERNIDEH